MTAHYELLGGSLKLEAAETGYRGGIDPILLASLAKGQGKIMDLGCGIGTAGLAVATRCPEIELSLLDISSRNIDFTKRNAEKNNISCTFYTETVKNKTALPANHFDEVIVNPPYFESGAYYEDEKSRKSLSNHEGESQTTLNEWLDCANYLLHAKGILTLIHRCERLDDIIAHLKAIKFGAITLIPLWPRKETPAKLILIQAQKGSKKSLCLHSGLILHEEGKQYTQETQDILYKGHALHSILTLN